MRIFIIDAYGLVGIALIYHNQDRQHPLFAVLTAPDAAADKYVTTEAGITAAFAIAGELGNDELVEALKRVVRYFFVQGMTAFEILRFENARIAQDFGDFIKGYGTSVPLVIGTTAFICADIYPGSKIIGKNHPLYASLNLPVEHVF